MASALVSAVSLESSSSNRPFGPRLLPQPVRLPGVAPASELAPPAPETVSCGVSELDTLTGGLPRGCLTEICGGVSSGRTSLLLASLAAATCRQEVCALVDTTDAFDPASGAAAGIALDRLLWVRCRGTARTFSTNRVGAAARYASPLHGVFADAVDQALRATDLLLQSGGFGLVAVDLGDVPAEVARRVPLVSWFRFRRAVENTPAVLLVVEQQPIAGSCSSLLVKMERNSYQSSAVSYQNSAPSSRVPSHTQLLRGMNVTAQVVRSRLPRKPAASAQTSFPARAVWA